MTLTGCISEEEKQACLEEVDKIIKEEIEDINNGKYFLAYKYIDKEGTKIDYTIDSIDESADENNKLIVSITYNITSDTDIEQYTDDELYLAGARFDMVFMREDVGDYDVSIIGKTNSDKSWYYHYVVNFNGEEIYSGKKVSEESFSRISSKTSGESKTCKFCGRRFTDSDNINSIAKTGMCENCYNNFQWGQKATGK